VRSTFVKISNQKSRAGGNVVRKKKSPCVMLKHSTEKALYLVVGKLRCGVEKGNV